MSDIDDFFMELDKIDTLRKLYHSVIINHCKNGNLREIKYILEKEPLLKKLQSYIYNAYVIEACKCNHFHILEFLINYFDVNLNTREENMFNHLCRQNNINALKNIIKITAKNKQVIDFNINEYREYGAWGEYIGTIITQIENPVILSYLGCCGAGSDNYRIIL